MSPYSTPPIALSQILNLSLSKGTFKNKSRTYIDSYLATLVVQVEQDNQGKPAVQPMKVSDVQGELRAD